MADTYSKVTVSFHCQSNIVAYLQIHYCFLYNLLTLKTTTMLWQALYENAVTSTPTIHIHNPQLVKKKRKASQRGQKTEESHSYQPNVQLIAWYKMQR